MYEDLNTAKSVYNEVVKLLYPLRPLRPNIPEYRDQILNIHYCMLNSYTGGYLGVSYMRCSQKRKKRWRFIYKGKTYGYFYTQQEAEEYSKKFHEDKEKNVN